MSHHPAGANFERVADIEPTEPTLIEGLPGHGLVASIAVSQINEQLGLEHYGNIYSDEFPPVITFENGLVRDLVRVYAGQNPSMLTLSSELALPQSSYHALGEVVLELATTYQRGIFLAGAPAEREAEMGNVIGIGTTEAVVDDLEAAGIQIAEEPGLVGGITGALVRECYHAGVPAALLIVRSHPFLPDPDAARQLIETALEPLVEFDIDTSELDEQAEEIREQLDQVAQQYRQLTEEEQTTEAPAGMYQ